MKATAKNLQKIKAQTHIYYDFFWSKKKHHLYKKFMFSVPLSLIENQDVP